MCTESEVDVVKFHSYPQGREVGIGGGSPIGRTGHFKTSHSGIEFTCKISIRIPSLKLLPSFLMVKY